MRRTRAFPVSGSSSSWQVYRTVPFWKVVRNVLVIETARYMPFFSWKNRMYRWLGMQVGAQTAMAYKVTMDILFPELIRIGKNAIIGYNTTILAHEYLVDEYRLGEVHIGDEVMIGANCLICRGSSSATGGGGGRIVVTRDVPPGAFVGGHPARPLRRAADATDRRRRIDWTSTEEKSY